MKITKRQLRRIIREEKRELLKESLHGVIAGVGFGNHRPVPSSVMYSQNQYSTPASLAMRKRTKQSRMREEVWDERRQAVAADVTAAMRAIYDAIDKLISAIGPEEAHLELQGIVDEWDSRP